MVFFFYLVQYKAIPITRMGSDALIQAKSGMGKTAVYAISILHQNPTPSDVIIKTTIIFHRLDIYFNIYSQILNPFNVFL